MESAIERQAIRAAVALAAASSHGRSPDVIADLRDESAQLIGLCVRTSVASSREVLSWCQDAVDLLQRFIAAGSLPDEQALAVSAAVLRLRLATTRVLASEIERVSKKTTDVVVEKRQVPEQKKQEPVKLTENLQVVAGHIKNHPGMRAKDIIGALAGTFSERSIKRYLSELVALRVASRRESEDGGVLYTLKD